MSSGYQTALSSTWLDVPGDLDLSGLGARNWHHHLRPPRHLSLQDAHGLQRSPSAGEAGVSKKPQSSLSHTWHKMLPKPPATWHPSLRDHPLRQHPGMPPL